MKVTCLVTFFVFIQNNSVINILILTYKTPWHND